MTEIWQQDQVLLHSQYLLDSYELYLGKSLIDREGDPYQDAEKLFKFRDPVVSHNTNSDPILNYGNQIALSLWEMQWQSFTQTPSRLTAELPNRAEREQMLTQAAQQGYITNYQGIRISSTGKRFLIKQGTIWNLKNKDGQPYGQAATFSQWDYLE